MQRLALLLVTTFFANICVSQPYECEPINKIEELRTSSQFTFKGPLTVEELEKEHMVEIRGTGKFLPFGYVNKLWVALKEKMQPGDEIHFRRFQDGRFFQEDYILVRNGCILFSVLKSIN